MTAPMPPGRLDEILRALPPHPAPGTTSCMARELAAEVERGWKRVTELEQQLTAARADRDAEIITWLGKKATEYAGAPINRHESKADVISRVASKIARGAVRPVVQGGA